MRHHVQIYCKTYSDYKIQDTLCGRSMVLMKLKLVRVNTKDEADATANVTAPTGYFNHGTKVL